MAEQGTLTGKFNGVKWTYTGGILNGKCHGKGKLTFENGEVYEGDFVDDKPQGKGKQTVENGDVYEGDFIDGKPQGKGKFTYSNGGVYEGDVVYNMRHGKGKFTFGGDVFEGDFVDNKPQKGKVTFANGKVEEGNFDDIINSDEVKNNIEFNIWYEERAKKILLICSAICFGLGLIFGVVVLTDANSLSTGIFLGIWYGTGLGGVISLFPRLFRAHKESGKKLSLGLTLVLSLFFMLIGPISLLIRILRMNYRIKKFKKQLSALG